VETPEVQFVVLNNINVFSELSTVLAGWSKNRWEVVQIIKQTPHAHDRRVNLVTVVVKRVVEDVESA
jgi:hypothetical protein